MGVFNFFIVIPQIVAAGILGFMLKSFFENDAIYAMVIGGVSMFLAGLLCLIVQDNEAPVEGIRLIKDYPTGYWFYPC